MGAGVRVRGADQPTSASYTPNTFYSYNKLGRTIQITRSGSGVYSVDFASFSTFTDGGNVQVTAYGSFGSAGPYCKVSSWGSETVDVRCFDAAGAAADSYFTAFYLKTPSHPTTVAYAWADQPKPLDTAQRRLDLAGKRERRRRREAHARTVSDAIEGRSCFSC